MKVEEDKNFYRKALGIDESKIIEIQKGGAIVQKTTDTLDEEENRGGLVINTHD